MLTIHDLSRMQSSLSAVKDHTEGQKAFDNWCSYVTDFPTQYGTHHTNLNMAERCVLVFLTTEFYIDDDGTFCAYIPQLDEKWTWSSDGWTHD